MGHLRGTASAMAWAASRSKNRITYAFPGWALWMIVCLGGAGGLVVLRERAKANQIPLLTSVSELVSAGVTRSCVTVTGFPIYEPLATERRNGRESRWFWRLRDEKEQFAAHPSLMVVVSHENPQSRLAQMVTLTGMLRRAEPDLHDVLVRHSANMRLLTTHYLDPDAGPLSPNLLLGGVIALALLGAMFGVGRLNQFTAFTARPMPVSGGGSVAAPSAEVPIKCLVTGSLPIAGSRGSVFVRDALADLVPGVDEQGRPQGHFVLSRVPVRGSMAELQLPIPSSTPARTGWVRDGGRTLAAVHVAGHGVDVYLKTQSPEHALAAQRAISEG